MTKEIDHLLSLRNKMICNDKLKVSLHSDTLIQELLQCISDPKLRKPALELLLLFHFSNLPIPTEEVLNLLTPLVFCNDLACLCKLKKDPSLFFYLKVLRILSNSELNNSLIILFNSLLNSTLPKEEAFLFFIDHPKLFTISTTVLMKHKLGIKVLVRLIKFRDVNVNKIIRMFKSADKVTKQIVLEVLVEVYRKEKSIEGDNLLCKCREGCIINQISNSYTYDSISGKSINGSSITCPHSSTKTLSKFIRLFTKVIKYEKSSSLSTLCLLSLNNLSCQQFLFLNGTVDILINSLINDCTFNIENPFLYFSLFCISSDCEEIRKFIYTQCKQLLFNRFNAKSISRKYDAGYYAMLFVFKGWSRSVHFLRSDLVELPLMDCLVNAIDDLLINPRDYYLSGERNENGTSYSESGTSYSENGTSYVQNGTYVENSTADSIDQILLHLRNNSVSKSELINQILCVLSNLLLDFGNYKSIFIQRKALKKILSLINRFPYTVTFLLKNLLYDSCLIVKNAFLKETDSEFFTQLFFKHSSNLLITEQILNIIRNLFCESELSTILAKFKLLPLIFKYLPVFIKNSVVLEHCLYVLVNMATNIDCRLEIRNNLQLNMFIDLLVNKELKIAFAWLVTNFSWKEYEDRGVNKEYLVSNNVVQWLRENREMDPFLDEKISTALDNLDC